MVINVRPCQHPLANLHHLSGGGGWVLGHVLLPWIQDGTLHTTDRSINKLMSAQRIHSMSNMHIYAQTHASRRQHCCLRFKPAPG